MVKNETSKTSIKKHTISKKRSESTKRRDEVGFELPIRNILVAIGIIILVAALVFMGFKYFNMPRAEKGAAAFVNGEEITWEAINSKYDMIPASLKATVTKESILNQTITETVLRQEMDKEGIETTEQELNTLIENVRSQFICDEQFNSTLAANGLNYAGFKEQLFLKIKLNRMIEKNVQGMAISEADMKTFFDENKDAFSTPEQVRAEHILVNSSETADRIIEQLNAGANFKELAVKYSTDKASLVCGGELGFFSKGMMIPEFEDAAFKLKIGETSLPVKTEYGYHVIRVLEKKPAKTANYEELKPLIEMSLFNNKLSVNRQLVSEYITSLVDKADIKRQ
jgi:foldase protein PrsA